MRYQAIIFDLDGVLIHTDYYHYLAWKQIADWLGIMFDEKQNSKIRGLGRMESLNSILQGHEGLLKEEEKKTLAEEKNKIYRAHLEGLRPDAVEPATIQLLNSLKTSGYRLGIGSSSRNARYILERIELTDYFEAIVDGNMIIRGKPDPEVFLSASFFLGTLPQECLVVEDAVAGVQAAKAAGMDCAAIGAAADQASPTYALQHLSDLFPILLGVPGPSGPDREVKGED